jgi:hypothetical protein
MKRLGINVHQLVHALRNGLKPYESSGESFDRQYRIYKLSNPGSSFPKDLDHETSDSRSLIESLMFSPSEVEEFVRNRQVNEAAPRSSSKPFPCKIGTKWSEVKITIINNENVRINTPHGEGSFHYSEIKLKDKRTDKPQGSWTLLLALAKTGRPKIKNLSKGVSCLNLHLQEIFGIKKSAFKPYRLVKKYTPNFNLSDKRAVISEKVYKESQESNQGTTAANEVQSIFDEESNKWGGNR